MKFDAILFDLDGTLLNTFDDLADSANAALAELGYPPHPAEAYKRFVGDGIANLARRILPQNSRDDDTVAKAVSVIRDRYCQCGNAKTRPYEGISELLGALTARKMPMGIFSNKEDASAKLCVRQFLSSWPFVSVMGTGGDVPIKPDPAGALMTADAAGIPAEKFCYLGDTNTDMRTAIAAGMYPVGASWGFRPASELFAHGAKVVIDHPSQLLDLL